MKVLIAGDFVPYKRVAAQINQGNYHCLEEAKPIIKSVDYSIVNLECPVVVREAKPIDKTGPNLQCTEKAIECLSETGFNCVTLANNHFRDQGQVGVEDTIDTCERYVLDYVGGGRTFEDASRILFKKINGQQLAIINVCEHEWSIATLSYGGSNPLDPINNYYSITQARKKADYVIVIVHGGIEHFRLPTPRMVDTYRFFIDAGADAVVNHHQHCYSGYEEYNGRPIFYGIGNFCFDKISNNNTQQQNIMWENGYMVELSLGPSISYHIYPYSQCTNENASVQLLDSNSFDSNTKELNDTIKDRLKLIQQFEQRAAKGFNGVSSILIPYSSNLAKRLVARHMLPSFVSSERIKRLLANVQCESHRDIMERVLKASINEI